MKKPFIYALGAALYIAFIVSVISVITSTLPGPDKAIITPIAILSLFVLSAAVMGFLFLSEPFLLYMENKKQEAIVFFAKIVGFFACFAVLFLILLFII